MPTGAHPAAAGGLMTGLNSKVRGAFIVELGQTGLDGGGGGTAELVPLVVLVRTAPSAAAKLSGVPLIPTARETEKK